MSYNGSLTKNLFLGTKHGQLSWILIVLFMCVAEAKNILAK